MRAYNRVQVKDYKGALSDYWKRIELDTSRNLITAEIFYYRGNIKQKLNDKKGACKDWTKAGELGFMKAFDSIRLNCN